MLPRDGKFIYGNTGVALVMNTKDPFSSTHSSVYFSKMLPRDKGLPKLSEIPLSNLSDMDSLLNNLSTRKRIITPNFNLFKGRYRKGQKLPSFMENINNRLTITELSYEMLKSNHYFDSTSAYDTQREDSKLLEKEPSNKYAPVTTRVRKSLFITSNHK